MTELPRGFSRRESQPGDLMGLSLLEEEDMRAALVSVHLLGLFVAAVVLYTTVADVQAWGEKGHRIAGHMAHDLLTP